MTRSPQADAAQALAKRIAEFVQGNLDDYASLEAALEGWRDSFVQLAKRAPPRSEAENIGQRFRAHGRTYVRFITSPDCKPANYLAEQALRFLVIDRKITQGTRSPGGQRSCERI